MGCAASSGGSAKVVFDYDRMLLENSHQQSVPFPSQSDQKQDQSALEAAGVKRSAVHRNALRTDALCVSPFGNADGCRTIWQAWQHGVAINRDARCLGTRIYKLSTERKVVRRSSLKAGAVGLAERGAYVFSSYEQVDLRMRYYGAGLAELGVMAGQSVAIYSMNRAEWTTASIGNHSQTVLQAKASCPDLKFVIQFDADEAIGNNEEVVTESSRAEFEAAGLKLFSFSKIIAMGKESGRKPVEPKPEDLAFIMYTSGTTGVPKGAMLSHGNVMACVAGVYDTLPIFATDIHVSYLPLAHMFETAIQLCIFCVGGQVAYYQGDPRKLTDDFASANVTVLCGVPRVFEKVYQRVMKIVSVSNFIKKSLVTNALESGYAAVRNGEAASSRILDTIRDTMGLQHVRMIVTGAAPMAAYLTEFLRTVIGCPVCQGYGMTETSAGSCLSFAYDYCVGHVGPPTTSTEICLEDVPDMGYTALDTYVLGDASGASSSVGGVTQVKSAPTTFKTPRGEILIRGPGVFKGYFKNEQATLETIGPDGWLHTGDIGRWNPNGTLSVIDRKKNMLKLSQGEYVALEKVENAYQNILCNQLWLYGNSYHSKLVAVVVPSVELLPFLEAKSWWPSGMKANPQAEFLEEFRLRCNEHAEDLKKEIMLSLEKTAKANGVKGFEKIHGVVLETTLDEMYMGFTIENDMLTPTQKYRRNKLVQKYEVQLRALYTQLDEPCMDGERW